MRARYAPLLALALALVPALLVAAPPVDVPAEVKGDVGAFVTVRGKTDGTTVRYVAIDPGLNVFPGDLLTDKKATVVSAARPGRYRLLAYSSVKDDPTEPAVVTVVIGDAPAPPVPPGPGPNPPGPNPPIPPAPQPVTSFRVLLVYESGDTLPAGQTGALFGRPVEEYLTAKCTGGAKGWDRRDKDTDAAADTTALKALWAAVKPAVTSVPCVAIEVNGKVTIEPLPATAAATVELLKKYRGE